VIRNPLVVGLRRLSGLIESCKSSSLGLMRDVDFYAFTGEILQRVVVLLAIY
jgi:hypothetical protein